MPRKTKKTVLAETSAVPDSLPATLTRQGTFTKTPDGSPAKMDLETQETASSPPRATRGRSRKTKKSGSPPKPLRTMPRRGRKHVQFSEEVHTISEEFADVKENEEPLSVDPSDSSRPKEARKRTRKTKKTADVPLEPPGLVREGTFTKSPDKPFNSTSVSSEPPLTGSTLSVQEEPQKRSRRGKRSKEEPTNPQTLVREGTFTKSPERSFQTDKGSSSTCTSTAPVTEDSPEETCKAAVEPIKKRSRRGKRNKEEPSHSPILILQTSPTSTEKSEIQEASETRESSQRRGPRGRSGKTKRSNQETSEPFGIVCTAKSLDTKSCSVSSQESSREISPYMTADEASDGDQINQDVQEAQPGLVREGTFTKSPEKDRTAKPAESPQKGNRKRKRTDEFTTDQPGLVREGTFTKNPAKRARSSNAMVPETERFKTVSLNSATPVQTPERLDSEEESSGSPVSQRRSTFTKNPRQSKRSNRIQPDQENVPAGVKREGTFTKSFEEETVKECAETGHNAVDALELKREGTVTKSPEKEGINAIPDFQANIVQTPGRIQNLSVFQRLSAKIPLSERRSLVSSEKRASLRNKYSTPQIDKKTQLTALREARRNNLTPKSITFKRGTTPTTPVQPVMKMPSSARKPKSAVKKPPNFAAIHERNFAKMESLLENKKRLRERADFLLSPTRPALASGIPKLVTKGSAPVANAAPKKSHIPIMKMAAKERLKAAVANKCTTGSILKRKDSKVLKGVRTNKRFELLLKQNNLKI